jgi:hypothetical protein
MRLAPGFCRVITRREYGAIMEVSKKQQIKENGFDACSRNHCFSNNYTEFTNPISEGHRDSMFYLAF